MNIEFTESGWEDFIYWVENDPDIVGKINDLLRSIKQDPFRSLGKPEPLKQNLAGYWSRRITYEHRLVYYTVRKGKTRDVVLSSVGFTTEFHRFGDPNLQRPRDSPL